ncbi:MAG TPA: CoA pyrophosphatase [Woeseiaceae bacterium]|nr:CoA pyrophosphatase [Woeseiaceae bacterium]
MPSPDALTAALLQERLAGTRAPQDPFDVVMPPGTERWPELVRERVARTLRPAGVLVPVIERLDGLSVLLTQRSAELKHHAGQVSFPGGRMEAHDADVVQAALRETHEEVGIPPQAIAVVGYLPPMPTVTGYAVTAVVGLLSDDISLQIDRTEVEYAFEVPLAFLLDARNERALEREYRGRRIPTVEFHYGGERIWGATAHILVELRKILIK